MKIGLICPYNMFRGGGVQECVLALKDGIISRGHEARIITPQPSGYKERAPNGLLLIGTARPIRVAHTLAQISVNGDVDKLDLLLEREKFDVLHFHEPWIPILSMQILLRSDAINVATFHAAMSERRTSRTVERVITPYTKSILKYLDVMTAVSPTATTYVRSLTTRKLEIIPNGIDLKKYSEPSLPQTPKRTKMILYIGRLESRKGVKYLLSAFDMIIKKDPTYSLIIAGDGPEKNKLKAQVERDMTRNVTFLGHIDEKKKQSLLKKADLFCSPALYGESFGIVLLEAMASGCVTVAGNNAGYEGVMKGHGQISLVNPKDTVEFARRIKILTTDDEYRKLWRDWAREAVKQYDYSHVIDQYVALYENAYAKK